MKGKYLCLHVVPAPDGLISRHEAPTGLARRRKFAVEHMKMERILDLRLDYPDPEVLAKMPLKRELVRYAQPP